MYHEILSAMIKGMYGDELRELIFWACVSGEGFSAGLLGKSTGSQGHGAQAVVVVSFVLYGDGKVSKFNWFLQWSGRLTSILQGKRTVIKILTTLFWQYCANLESKSTAKQALIWWSLYRILFTDVEVGTTLCSILNITTGKCCLVAFIWMVTLWELILRLKCLNHLVRCENHVYLNY